MIHAGNNNNHGTVRFNQHTQPTIEMAYNLLYGVQLLSTAVCCVAPSGTVIIIDKNDSIISRTLQIKSIQ